MKFRIEKDVLADVVTWVSRTLPPPKGTPALAGVLIEADEQSVSFTTNAQDMWSRALADGVVGEPGRVLISGRLLVEIARSLPNQPVSFGLQTTGRVEVSCGSASFVLPTMPNHDFPSPPPLPDAIGSVDAATFAEAVSQVAVATSAEGDHHTYSGIRMEVEPGGDVTLAATDRYRLAVRDLPWRPHGADRSIAVTVPGRALVEAAKACADVGELLLHFGDGDTTLSLSAGERRTGLRLMDSANFPKFRSLIPSQFIGQPEVEVSALKESLKRVSLVLHQDSPVRLAFSPEEVILRAGVGDDAIATETIPCTLHGEGMEVAFNPKFLSDGLAGLGQGTVRISLQSAEKAAVLTGVDAEGGVESFRYLLMPVRFSGR